jgi:hypothetical protein
MTDRELMQQALEALGLVVWTNNPPVTDAITALRERLAPEEPTRAEKMREAGYTRRPSLREFPSDKPAQPEQEPVAWANEIIDDLHALHDSEMIRELDSGDALIRLEAAIATVEEAEQRHTAPQRREWVGLTEDEVAQAMYRADAIITGPMQFKFAKEIEAKLKEKNQ